MLGSWRAPDLPVSVWGRVLSGPSAWVRPPCSLRLSHSVCSCPCLPLLSEAETQRSLGYTVLCSLQFSLISAWQDLCETVQPRPCLESGLLNGSIEHWKKHIGASAAGAPVDYSQEPWGHAVAAWRLMSDGEPARGLLLASRTASLRGVGMGRAALEPGPAAPRRRPGPWQGARHTLG
nr:PREDICTED: uncharacterized protein LOC103552405 isoform X2 [Equus przewalskii]